MSNTIGNRRMHIVNRHFSDATLEEYCLGLLSQDDTIRIEEHIVSCPACGERMYAQSEWVSCVKTVLVGTPVHTNFFQASA